MSDELYHKGPLKLISHRGNIIGPMPELENTMPYIEKALSLGYSVEIDVWNIRDLWFTGHDGPINVTHGIDWMTENKDRLLIHAKNASALQFLLQRRLHCFWHENDDFTLTSKGIPICYPNRSFFSNCILMKVEYFANPRLQPCWGICSDYISLYQE